MAGDDDVRLAAQGEDRLPGLVVVPDEEVGLARLVELAGHHRVAREQHAPLRRAEEQAARARRVARERQQLQARRQLLRRTVSQSSPGKERLCSAQCSCR